MDYKRILELMIKHLDEGVIVVDSKLDILYFNEPSTNITGFDSKKAVGENLFHIFPNISKDNSTFWDVISTGKPIIEHVQQYINCQGRNVTIVTSTIPITNGNNMYGAIEIFKDITQVMELSEKVLMLQETLYNKRQDENKFLSNGTQYTLRDIIGNSTPMKKLKDRICKVAFSNSPVFVFGETGTGKELVVQSIHNLSYRKDKPFIAQNCGALPENLLESILFGTIQGGFTGAKDKQGLFELADGGTLFLDELNSMSLELQAKLLRVIEDGVVRRLGDTTTKVVNVRIIAASNIEPKKLLEEGKLREDLYYRLNVIYLHIPPLRERREDIPILVDYFIQSCNKKMHMSVKGLDKEVAINFYNNDWLGNVRELENTIESAMNFVEGEYITMKDLQNYNLPCMGGLKKEFNEPIKQDELSLKESVEEYEKQLIRIALEEAENNCAKAARILKVPKQTLHGKIKRYDL
ncbi:sigma-54 interaction domain-containing protein [Schnuerera sp.]|uniref:sigma-54 interaction domain-containing protein n=1 Tax=Schnuerera sp. TaxID=2794844 RepID=UPI002BC41485|nr:sigma 54-interacting transcriptional regulator [Schnuerera sp.]HSH35479.1 sigma 54-interacting transcriptional regulator [Schnuerera sp.]